MNENRRYSLIQIAEILGAPYRGDGELSLIGLCPLDEGYPGGITFCGSADLAKVHRATESSKASVFIIHSSLLNSSELDNFNLIGFDNPILAMTNLVEYFYPRSLPQPGVSRLADIHDTALISNTASIGAFCSIGQGAQVSDNVVLFPHVVLYPGVKIGTGSVIHSGVVVRENCSVGAFSTIQSGAIVGSDGFGYIPDPKTGLRAVPQIGRVELSDRVDIGANSCIDRATFGTTRIGHSTKIDNLVQIGHNVEIGSHSILCGLVGIAGSSKIGSGVTLAGGSGVGDHVTVADGVRAAGRAGLTNGHYEKGDYAGLPAVKISQWQKSAVFIRRLPELFKRLSALEKKVGK